MQKKKSTILLIDFISICSIKVRTETLLERLRNRYAKNWYTLFQALLYNSIYCLYFNIKFINFQVIWHKNILRKFVSFLLIYYKIYAILTTIGNDDKQMWFCHQILRIFVGEVVMFMVKVILFFIISLMLSLTLNVALTAVLYKNWVDKQLHK